MSAPLARTLFRPAAAAAATPAARPSRAVCPAARFFPLASSSSSTASSRTHAPASSTRSTRLVNAVAHLSVGAAVLASAVSLSPCFSLSFRFHRSDITSHGSVRDCAGRPRSLEDVTDRSLLCLLGLLSLASGSALLRPSASLRYWTRASKVHRDRFAFAIGPQRLKPRSTGRPADDKRVLRPRRRTPTPFSRPGYLRSALA